MSKKTTRSASSTAAVKSPGKKVTNAQRVRDYKAAHPRAKNGEIAAALGINYQTVYATLGKSTKRRKKAATSKAKTSANGLPNSATDIDKAIRAVELAHELLRIAGSEGRAQRALSAANKLRLA